MAEIIRMPKMSDTMTEGVIAAWHKKVGDTVKSGDIIAEVETDKATMDMESYYDGTLLYIGVEKGQAAIVDGIVAIVGAVGEDFQSLLGDTPKTAPVETPVAPVTETPQVVIPTVASAPVNVNAVVIRMPKMSDTMNEGVIHSWLKKVGDKVKSGDIIAEVETDKATMELENYEDGTLLYIGVEAGNAAPVDGIIAIVGEEGADYKTLLSPLVPNGGTVISQPTINHQLVEEVIAVTPPLGAGGLSGRILASPLAKAIAKEKGIDIAAVAGSGEGGRIIKADVDKIKGGGSQPAVISNQPTANSNQQSVISNQQSVISNQPLANSNTESYEDMPLSQMRKTIARRLSESKFSAPEFYLTMEINMDKAMAARTSMNEISPVKISFNDMVIKAVSAALTKHRMVNASWLGDKIRINNHVHIGMAVAVEDGLLVPVIRFANTKSLSQIATETKDLGGKAKTKQLQPKDWEGNTFTVSNLGMFGIDEFTSIINPPESCIMAVGGIKETVAVKDGQFYATNIMKVTLTCDHRVVDGATGAQFLVTFKQLLEDPIKLLV